MLHALILGIVEGLTEFLPISSTGHLLLTGKALGIPQTEFLKTFDISIQLGAILSVVALYWRRMLIEIEVIKRIIVAFIPTAILGLIFYNIIKRYLFENMTIVLWALFLGGIFLVGFELLYREKEGAPADVKEITYTQSLAIGLFQAAAFIPGVSRAAATIIGGLALGLKRKTIVEFSFLLAVPTMLAATGLDLARNASLFSLDQIGLLTVGFLTSFAVALISIKFLLFYIRDHNFIPFGAYRIILAVCFWFWLSSCID